MLKNVNIGDVTLHVVDQGEGTPLLLVHGFPLSHAMWQAQIDAFSTHCRVIAPDLRGFGRSGVTSGTVTMEQYADDLNALLDRLEITEPVAFVGLSMGGYIAWQFWRKYSVPWACWRCAIRGRWPIPLKPPRGAVNWPPKCYPPDQQRRRKP